MAANGVDLLRMLEPAVRPVGAGGPSGPKRLPIEDRSFESLLVDARSAGESGGGTEAAEPQKLDPLESLSGLGAIESASLRNLIASRAPASGVTELE